MAFKSGPQSIVQDKLVWAADAGNTLCFTPGSATATDIIGDTTLTLANGAAISGTNSWRFDGTDDSLTSTTGPTLSATATFSCWFNPSSYANYEPIVSSANYYTGGYNNNWAIQLMGAAADYKLRIIFNNGTSVNSGYIDPGNLTGTWNYLVVTTEDSTTVKTYLNIPPEEDTLTLNKSQTNPMADVVNGIEFGRDSQDNEFDGYVGCMLLYNKLLSTAEMLQNYNATKNRFQ